MKNITRFTGLLFAAAIMTFAFSSESQAVPAFARQMGVSCNTCHFQHFPELNAFGRSFKASGYSMKGSQALIEDENLSIPVTLNATFVTKLRDIKTNGTSGTGRDVTWGQSDLPDEAGIILAGRAGEHVGFLAELAMVGQTDSTTTPAAGTAHTHGLNNVANLKVPIGWEVGEGNIEVVPFTTDALGPQEGFELMSTGAVGSVRAFEDHVRAGSAARYLQLTDGSSGAATGLAFVYANPLFYVNITPYEPTHGGGPVTSFANYARVAVTPQVAGWDLGLGVQYWGGTYEGASGSKQDSKAMIVDAQAMGNAGGMPLGVFLSYGSVPKADAGTTYSTGNGANDATVTSISAELGVHPKGTVGVAYRTGTNSASLSDNAAEIIGTYKLAQNIQVGLTYATMGGDANKSPNPTNEMMLNMFAAF